MMIDKIIEREVQRRMREESRLRAIEDELAESWEEMREIKNRITTLEGQLSALLKALTPKTPVAGNIVEFKDYGKRS